MYGQGLGVDVNGVDNAALCRIVAGLPAGASPGLLLGADLEVDEIGHLDRLHHLSDDAVCDEKYGDTVLLCLVVCKHHDINCFLNGGGCVGQQVVVTVAAALDCLEVVALGSLNVAEAGATTHNIEDDTGKHCACAVGDTFLLQGDAGAGGRSDCTGTGTGCAVDHVDSCDFGLCLQEAAVYFGIEHTSRHVLRDLSLRGDRIAEEVTGAGSDGGLCNSFATLHKSFGHFSVPPYSFSMWITTSGQVRAQDAQPMHSSGLTTSAG